MSEIDELFKLNEMVEKKIVASFECPTKFYFRGVIVEKGIVAASSYYEVVIKWGTKPQDEEVLIVPVPLEKVKEIAIDPKRIYNVVKDLVAEQISKDLMPSIWDCFSAKLNKGK